MQGCERLHSDEEVHDTGCIAVVGAIVELANCWVVNLSVSRVGRSMSLYTHIQTDNTHTHTDRQTNTHTCKSLDLQIWNSEFPLV